MAEPPRNVFSALMGAGGKRKSESGPPRRELPKRTSDGSSLVPCPVCGKYFHKALIEAHAAACEPPPEIPLPALADEALPPPKAVTAPPPGEPTPPSLRAAPAATPAAANAFSVLTAAAAEAAKNADAGAFELAFFAETGELSARWHSTTAAAGGTFAWRKGLEVSESKADAGGRGGARRRSTVMLVSSNLPSLSSAFVWPEHATCRAKPSVLKSAVQKSVRLCRPQAAVRAAAALLSADTSDGLRRLCIICCEDAVVDARHFPVLVWLVAALSQGFHPPPVAWAAVLRAVHALACCPLRDPGAADGADTEAPLSLFSLSPLPTGDGGLVVRALLLRAQFGGMKGDIAMLKQAAAVWARRYSGGEMPPRPALDWPSYLRSTFEDAQPEAEHVTAAAASHPPDAAAAALRQLESVPPLRLRDVPPSALDFHCSSLVTDLMADARLSPEAAAALDATGEEQEGALRSLIWRFRSSLSSKRALGAWAAGGGGGGEADRTAAGRDRMREAWPLLEGLVDLHQRRLLGRSFAPEAGKAA